MSREESRPTVIRVNPRFGERGGVENACWFDCHTIKTPQLRAADGSKWTPAPAVCNWLII